MDKNVTIPEKDRVEWRQIVKGEFPHSYRNYVLQMKVHQTINDVKSSSLTIEEGVNSLYDLCYKYAKAVQSDCKIIFKQW